MVMTSKNLDILEFVTDIIGINRNSLIALCFSQLCTILMLS